MDKIGIPSLYVTDDSGATDDAVRKGTLSLRLVLGWAKSHSFITGQTPVMKYNMNHMQVILSDKINIAEIVNVEVLSLDEAPSGYEKFDSGVSKQ